MPEIFDTAVKASIESVLMCKSGHGHGDRADVARFIRVIQPRSRRKKIHDRSAKMQTPQRVSQAQIEDAEIDEHHQVGLRRDDMKRRAQHRVQKLRNSRNGGQRSHARPARMIAPERKVRVPHPGASNPFELRVGIEFSNLFRQKDCHRLTRRLPCREKIFHCLRSINAFARRALLRAAEGLRRERH